MWEGVPRCADGWGEEAAIFIGEVVRQCAALLEGEVARIMEVFWQPVEDMMEEVEVVAEKQQQQVVAEEQEEKPQEQGQEEPGPSPKSASLEALEALKVLQLQLEPVNAECSRQLFRLKVTTLMRRKPYLEHRSTIIQSIPGFWVKVFVNHPRMSAMISTQDKEMLSYMTNLKVEELADPSDYRKIMLFFRKNPFFQNEVVVKEYLIEATRYRASHLAPIQWHRRFEEEVYSRRHNNSSLNFFNWFSDHSCVGSSRIAEIIGEDLWPNPLRYYPREKGPTGTGHREEDSGPLRLPGSHRERPHQRRRLQLQGHRGLPVQTPVSGLWGLPSGYACKTPSDPDTPQSVSLISDGSQDEGCQACIPPTLSQDDKVETASDQRRIEVLGPSMQVGFAGAPR
ncbi:testis-specific Y-encoded protein 3-like [Globicephala melas]|uniref:testis-specific Y-encoded protein 3-like n=1 Tax=Globicephala melas TaxID=9731 RepID=UPI00293D3D14|nr:testis-specific Y-encoded protein 3-like [Globicephala melas]